MAEKWKLDFSGVEDKGFDIDPGKYLAKVKSIEKKSGSEYPYLEWKLVITTGSAKGSMITHRTTLKPSGLFNLRNTLIALGLEVPKSAIALDPSKLIGKQLCIEVVNEPYEGKDYPKVKKTLPVSAYETKEVSTASVSVAVTDDDDDVMVLTDDDL